MPPIAFNILKYIIDEYFFERLKEHCDCEGFQISICFCEMEYDEFLQWNYTCYQELTPDKKIWIKVLCADIKNEKIMFCYAYNKCVDQYTHKPNNIACKKMLNR